jgi:hypothetical protein
MFRQFKLEIEKDISYEDLVKRVVSHGWVITERRLGTTFEFPYRFIATYYPHNGKLIVTTTTNEIKHWKENLPNVLNGSLLGTIPEEYPDKYEKLLKFYEAIYDT